MFKMLFENVQQQTPLVHCITNYVTVNDVANALLAAGGSPIMADAPEEVADITSICTALNLNIGTLNSRAVESMLLAGRQANALAHPVVLD
nr:hydroxyethylthiazole kinase [Trichococcus flocculiformis]